MCTVEPVCLPRSCSNNENRLFRKGAVLFKEGPTSSLEGELYFYTTAKGTSFQSMLPAYIGCTHESGRSTIEMEFIEGQTPSYLFRNRLLTRPLLASIVGALDTLHSSKFDDGSVVTPSDILATSVTKLVGRIADEPDIYALPHIERVVDVIREVLTGYFMGPKFEVTNIIHGDPWFDNMIVDKEGTIRLLDMRGKIGSAFSLKGDKMTDYAKLYQSILGFDFHINNETYDPEYETQCRTWLSELLPVPLDDPVLECVTACMVLRTFHYFSDRSCIPVIYKSIGKLALFSFLLDA